MNKILPITFLLVFLAITASANAYNITYVAKDTSGNTLIPSVYTPNLCTVNMYLRDTAGSSGSFTISDHYYSPDYNEKAYSILTFENNITCRPMNSVPIQSTDTLNSFYEATTNSTHTAQTFNSWQNTTYDCGFDANELFIYNDTDRVDSYGNHPFGYGKKFGTCFAQSPSQCTNDLAGDLNSVINYLETGYYANCGTYLRIDKEGEEHHTTSCGSIQSDVDMNYWIMIPFNSMSSGIVNISIFGRMGYRIGGGTLEYSNQYYLWETVTDSTTNLGSSFPFSTSQTLIPERDYWLLIGTRYYIDNHNCGSGVDWGVVHNYTSYSISIWAYEPAWECGEWSECLDGIETRFCVDQLGKVSNKSEQQTCFDVPAHEIDLGFEGVVDFLPSDIYICQKDWTVLGCTDSLQTISSKFPINWTISADADLFTGDFRQNYIRITGETSTVGTKSLQMNYIPPKPSEPINNGTGGTICGNKTSGDFPFVTTGLNQSIFVSINISFPSPFIQLRLDARKCSEQILQYDYTGDFLGINCGKRCYAPNCTGEPKGKYSVGVFDAQTLEEVVEFSDVAINSWTFHIIDLSNAGLIVNHNYTIIIVVNPEVDTGVFDPDAHCVYFDNFRVTITETALPECVTICEGFDLLLANQNGDICFFTRIANSPSCAPDTNTAESFQNFEEICIGTTLHFFNNDTGLWDRIEDSELCESQAAVTEEDINITTPLEDTGSYIEFFDFLFSPIFIYIIFSLIISGILSAGIARITKNGDGVFQVFGITMLIFVLLGSLPGIAVIPMWISIAIIVVISLMVAQKLRNFGFTGGGG